MTMQPYLHKPDELLQVARSNKPDVRNPMLALPGVTEAAASVPAEARAALYRILMALRADAQAKAAESWRKHKAPMALYWKCLAVYAGHIAKLFRSTVNQ